MNSSRCPRCGDVLADYGRYIAFDKHTCSEVAQPLRAIYEEFEESWSQTMVTWEFCGTEVELSRLRAMQNEARMRFLMRRHGLRQEDWDPLIEGVPHRKDLEMLVAWTDGAIGRWLRTLALVLPNEEDWEEGTKNGSGPIPKRVTDALEADKARFLPECFVPEPASSRLDYLAAIEGKSEWVPGSKHDHIYAQVLRVGGLVDSQNEPVQQVTDLGRHVLAQKASAISEPSPLSTSLSCSFQ